MTKENSNSLRISSRHFRTADIVMAIISILIAIFSAYYVVTENSREYWLLLLVGVVAAVLLLRRSRIS